MSGKRNAQSFAQHVLKIGEELAVLEIRLQTPKHTVKDLVRHMQLIKELRKL